MQLHGGLSSPARHFEPFINVNKGLTALARRRQGLANVVSSIFFGSLYSAGQFAKLRPLTKKVSFVGS